MTGRLYSEQGAPMCTVCRTPMVAGLGLNIHPACDPTFPLLLDQERRTRRRRDGEADG